MKKKIFVVAAVIIGSQLHAQVNTTNEQDSLSRSLEEVIVTASKTRLKQSQTGKIVTVIDEKTITNNAGRTISELLNTQAGVFINGANNNLGTNTDVYFRGAGSGNTLIVIDGIPVFDPSAPTSQTIDLNNISLEQVERIEILKGGQSTIWGSDAVAGVIQIFLKKTQEKKINVTGTASYGSFNTFRGNIGVNGSYNKFGYRVQYGYTGTDGISVAHDSTGKEGFDDDEFRQHSVMAEVSYRFNNELSLRLFENFSSYNTGLDAGAFTDDKDYTTDNKNNLAGIGIKYNRKKLSWNFLASYQRMNRLTIDDSSDISSPWASFSKGNYEGKTVNLESFINKSFTDKIELVAGLQYINQQSDQSYLSVSSFGPYESKLGDDSVRANYFSAYTSLLLKEVSRFNFELGGRWNHHSLYGSNGTFTFNPSFVFDNNSKVFVNISSGFRVPTLYQLYSEFGNRDLKPERSITYEIGLQTASDDDKIDLRIAAFKRDSKNLIAFGLANYINRDEQHDYGFEVEAGIALSTWGKWNNNITFINGQGVENGNKVNNLYRRPNFTFNSSITLSPLKQLTVIPSFRYVGSRLKNPFDLGPAEQPHYYTIDLFASYTIKKVKLFVDLRNITDQEYFDIVGYNSKPFNFTTGLSFSL